MTNRCLDEGILQAYIDGELPREQAAEATAHLAACGACSAALAEAEGATSFFAAAFAPDEALSVPSEVLRARINASIAQLEASAEPNPRRSPGRSFGGFLATLSGLFSFTPQGAVAFATLLAAVAVGIIYFSSHNSQQRVDKPQAAPDEVAQVSRPTAPIQTPAVVEPPSAPTEKGNGRSGYTQVKHVPRIVRRAPAAPSAPKEEALPGEKEYQTAIASLEKTIKVGGDESLRPSLRADYERNLALLDSAITQTRQVAARNPKDKDAVDFLMAAYQSKVELLSRVADQAQVSTLGR
jgi:anti-sigma factor RsiW